MVETVCDMYETVCDMYETVCDMYETVYDMFPYGKKSLRRAHSNYVQTKPQNKI